MFYLYRFLNLNDEIIYIGKTKNALRVRFSQHSHLPKACYSAVNKIEFLECSTEADMSMKEIYYINKYKSQGLAEYNVADVSTLPREIEYDEESDVWKMYEGSLPETFSSSVNVLEGFKEEEKEFVQRADGKTIRYSQNSKVGKEKFVYPLSVDGVEQAIYYFIDKMNTAQNWRYLFYHFRNIVILSMGVSTPMKSNELIELKICDVYDKEGKVKPFEFKSKGEMLPFPYPENVIWLLKEYHQFLVSSFRKDRDYWMFWGQRDDGTHISPSTYGKTLTVMTKELQHTDNLSMESLRKSFLRYIFDASEDKYEALECIDFFIAENYRHTPARILKYIDIVDHNRELDPAAFMKGKYIMDAVSNKCIVSIQNALKKVDIPGYRIFGR